jgi:hypothetical protein
LSVPIAVVSCAGYLRAKYGYQLIHVNETAIFAAENAWTLVENS